MIANSKAAASAYLLVASAIGLSAAHGKAGSQGGYLAPMEFDRTISIGDIPRRSASVSIADFNGDDILDIVLLNGRHWEEPNLVFFGDGKGNFAPARSLSDVEDRSYTGAVADLDGDGDLDIAVSNDRPDASYILLNDGTGEFTIGGTFGQPEWTTRNIALTDIDGDGLPDVIVANRGPLTGPSPNYICLNKGEAQFAGSCHAFSQESATTITPHDVDQDGRVDLIVPSRDGGQSHVYLSGTASRIDLKPVPFGPADASIRAAQSADFDGDGLMDIVAIHTGNSEGGDGVVDRGRPDRGTVLYRGLPNGGFADGVAITDPARMPYALSVADLDRDGRPDILVGHVDASSTVLFNTGDSFGPLDLGDTDGTTYGFGVADLDRDGTPDIVAARSGAVSMIYFGARVKSTTVQPKAD